MSALPSSPMLYGSKMGSTILIVLTIYSGCHYSLQEHKSPPVQIRSIPTQKTVTCALMNPRKVQENENLVSESWCHCVSMATMVSIKYNLKLYIEATNSNLNSTMIVQTVRNFSDWEGRIHDCLFTSSGTWWQSRTVQMASSDHSAAGATTKKPPKLGKCCCSS